MSPAPSFGTQFPAAQALQAQTVLKPVYVSDDNGSSWSPLNPGASQVYALAIPPGQSSTIYAATSTGLFKSTNSGGTWTNLLPSATAAWHVVLDAKNPSTVYATFSDTYVYTHTLATKIARAATTAA